MPAAAVFIIGSYEYKTAGARKGYGREIAKSLQLFALEQGSDAGHGEDSRSDLRSLVSYLPKFRAAIAPKSAWRLNDSSGAK